MHPRRARYFANLARPLARPLATLPYTSEVEFTVGQVVVTRAWTGRVVASDTRAATPEPQDVVVLELAATLTVTLPIALAHEQLRAVVNETELASVQTTLRAAPRAREPLWIKRQKETRAKLASGQAICLAEVISDGAHRQRGQAARLSVNERELYLKAEAIPRRRDWTRPRHRPSTSRGLDNRPTRACRRHVAAATTHLRRRP